MNTQSTMACILPTILPVTCQVGTNFFFTFGLGQHCLYFQFCRGSSWTSTMHTRPYKHRKLKEHKLLSCSQALFYYIHMAGH